MTDTSSPADALAGVRAINAEMARKVRCPPQYHLALGLLMGTMVAGQTLSPLGALAVLVPCLGGLALMFRWQRRRLGVFVNGYRRGRTRTVALSLLVVVETLLFGSMWLKFHGVPLAPLFAGILAVPATMVGSYIWQAAYRTDLAHAAA